MLKTTAFKINIQGLAVVCIKINNNINLFLSKAKLRYYKVYTKGKNYY